ncbi:MAG: hypothetical protein ACLRZ6_05190 [Lachnospiraceae bacterium]
MTRQKSLSISRKKAAERTESTKPAEKAQEMAKTEAPKETMTRKYKNDRNDSRSTNDGNEEIIPDVMAEMVRMDKDAMEMVGQSEKKAAMAREGRERDGNGKGGQRRRQLWPETRRNGQAAAVRDGRDDGNGQGGYGQRWPET